MLVVIGIYIVLWLIALAWCNFNPVMIFLGFAILIGLVNGTKGGSKR